MNTRAWNVLLALALANALGLISACRTAAQSFTNLHDFVFTNGIGPVASLLLSGTTLYGTTRIYGGGTGGGYGSVFKLNTDGSGFTTLHIFSGDTDGGNLNGSVVLAGNRLYGTATFGGGSNYGCIFGITTNGAGLTNIYNFSATSANFPSTNSDGAYPLAGLVLSGDTLYGTANGGGTKGWGTLFAVNTNGAAFTNLHNFSVSDGQYPAGSLLLSGSALYGATPGGGSFGYGTLFKVNTNGAGFTNFYSFSAASGSPATNSDGAFPACNLVLSGNTLYGTTPEGGTSGSGTIFKVNTDGSGFEVLHHFTATAGPLSTNSDGTRPQAGLVLYGNALYGTASAGGTSGNGTVFKVNTDGTGFSTVYRFTSTNGVAGTNSDGARPVAGLIRSGSTLYGTASAGGASGYGTVFSILVPPPLTIAASGNNVILTWPVNVTGFNLQSATNLAPSAIWEPVSDQHTVTNPISGRQKFYRLIHP